MMLLLGLGFRVALSLLFYHLWLHIPILYLRRTRDVQYKLVRLEDLMHG
jgi:hypothetical protein